MKKIYVAMAVLATALLSSCVQEKNFNNITVGENELSFAMQGVATRSGEATPTAVKGVIIPIGEGIMLEETIEELNPGPATKGQPVYTVTLPDVYPSMGVYADGKFGDAVFNKMDDTQYENQGWRYNHNYDGSPWPDDKTKDVTFYLRMPANGGGISNYNKTTFELTSPDNGLDQQDLLFGQATMSKEEHDAKLPAGYPVTMKHALSGIKFRNGHPNGTMTKTIITRVELIGLNKYGKGTVGEDGVVTWDPVNPVLSTEEAPFYLQFDNPDYDETAEDLASNPDGTVTTWSAGLTGTSWTGENAASDHNLNHANGELTFWFIPQEISDDVILKVYFTVKTPDSVGGFVSDACHTINLGEMLNEKYQSVEGNEGKNLKWEAGQLRTYTLKPFDVDVEIEDEISATTKSDLHIANTGNVDEYVRMLIMGNWYGWESQESKNNGDEPSILVGYKYQSKDAATAAGEPSDPMMLPWYREGYPVKDDVYYATEAEATENGWVKDTDGYGDPYGHFDSTFALASLGDRDGDKDDWADASGGFYYTMPIGPGDGIGSAQAATKALFESYEVTKVPKIYIATSGVHRTEAVGVHLVMEIVVQAIAVPKNDDGTNKWWLQAWYEATGISKLDPDADRNAAYKAKYEAGEYNQE